MEPSDLVASAPLERAKDEGVIVIWAGGIGFPLDFGPRRLGKGGEKDIAPRPGVHFGQIHSLRPRQRESEDRGAADDANLLDTVFARLFAADLYGFGKVITDQRAGRCEGAVSREHDIEAAWQWSTRQGIPRHPTHYDRLADGQVTEESQVGLQAPGQPAAHADHPVLGPRDGTHCEEDGQTQTAIGARIAG